MTPARPTAPGRLVVVGAGITGLAAAFEWRRRRPDDEIVVLEAGDRIGGKLHRIKLAGPRDDTGPQAMLARAPESVDLVEALGLGDRLVAPATTQASVVLPHGRHPLPPGSVLGFPASADGLEGFLSPEGVARVRAEADLPPLTVDGDVAVGGLLRERLGEEGVDRLGGPLGGGGRWSPGWWNRCSVGCTPAGPTSCRSGRRCPRWPRTCRASAPSWVRPRPPVTPGCAAGGTPTDRCS